MATKTQVMNQRRIDCRPVLGMALLIFSAEYQSTKADWILIREGTPFGANVYERGDPGTQVKVVWTDKDGNELKDEVEGTIPASRELCVPLPPGKHARNQTNTLVPIADFKQFSKVPNPGEESVLDVVAFEPSGSDFLVTPFDEFVRLHRGFEELRIPDLYADTNGDQILGAGDVLYSAVNLADYIPGNVNFNLGDSFSIVNGSSPQLPGMLFGTQPIFRDASSPTGYVNPAPYTGIGSALTEHAIQVVPEPSSLVFVALGMLARRFVTRQ